MMNFQAFKYSGGKKHNLDEEIDDVFQDIIEVKGNNHKNHIYEFRKIYTMKVSGSKEMITSFKTLLEKGCAKKKKITDNNIIETLLSMDKVSERLFSNTLKYQYGCKYSTDFSEDQDSQSDDQDDDQDDDAEQESKVKIEGYKPDMVLNMINNHPSFKVDISKVALYPNYWTRINEVIKKEQEGMLIKLDDKSRPQIIFRQRVH